MSSRGLLLSALVVVMTATLLAGPARAHGDVVAGPEPSQPGPATPVPPTPAPGGPTPPLPAPDPVVVVIGDSISSTSPDARYRTAETAGRRPEVWWSLVVGGAGVRPSSVVELATGGTGYVRRGALHTSGGTRPCRGTVFADRLPALEDARPDVVIVAGGRNDGYRCTTSVHRTKATPSEQRAAIASFHARLAQVVRRRGLAEERVFVTAPWGSADQDGRAAIAALVEAAARRHGFTYVPLSPLQRGDLLDTTHPDASGVRAIAGEFVRASGIQQVLRGLPPRPTRATRLTAGPCSGSERGDAARRTWGRSGAEGLVAARLVRHRRVPLAPATSAGWLADALAAGADVVARPRAGDVAWWPARPGTPRGRREHVATVLRTTGGGAVVAEVGAGGRCERTGYRDAAMPRAYLRFPAATGTPRGAASVARAGSRSVRVTGWAVDPDAGPGTRTRLRVSATVGGRSVARLVRASTYELDVLVRLDARARGRKVRVVVEALNAPGTRGSRSARLGTRTLRPAR